MQQRVRRAQRSASLVPQRATARLLASAGTAASPRVPEAPCALPFDARYQINARTELAVRYNDISPLENHHCAVAFQILAQPECNIFANVQLDEFKQIRQVCRGKGPPTAESGDGEHNPGAEPPCSSG